MVLNRSSALVAILAVGLFVGARAWKKGSDRAHCMLNVRNVQQALRGHEGMNNLSPGSPIPIQWDKIIGKDGLMHIQPTCPSGGTYTFSKTGPKMGELACKCSIPDHEPPDHKEW